MIPGTAPYPAMVSLLISWVDLLQLVISIGPCLGVETRSCNQNTLISEMRLTAIQQRLCPPRNPTKDGLTGIILDIPSRRVVFIAVDLSREEQDIAIEIFKSVQ